MVMEKACGRIIDYISDKIDTPSLNKVCMWLIRLIYIKLL